MGLKWEQSIHPKGTLIPGVEFEGHCPSSIIIQVRTGSPIEKLDFQIREIRCCWTQKISLIVDQKEWGLDSAANPADQLGLQESIRVIIHQTYRYGQQSSEGKWQNIRYSITEEERTVKKNSTGSEQQRKVWLRWLQFDKNSWSQFILFYFHSGGNFQREDEIPNINWTNKEPNIGDWSDGLWGVF